MHFLFLASVDFLDPYHSTEICMCEQLSNKIRDLTESESESECCRIPKNFRKS